MDVFRSGSNCIRVPIKFFLCTMVGCIFLLSTKVSSFASNNAGYRIKKLVFRSQFRTFAEKARVVFLGTPDVAASSLSRLIEKSKEDLSVFDIVGVVTQPPKRRRRKSAPEPSPVGKVAEEHGIMTLCPEKAKDPEFLDALENDMKPDLCITAAYGQYLTKRFLATPKFGTLNIHPSLLPRWRGASPVQRSLEAGDDPIGVSVLFTVSKMDAGPIVKQTTKSVDKDSQATEVLPFLFEVGTEDLLEVMPKVISGEINMDNARKQSEDGVVAASMIEKAEGELKVWKESATSCHNKVRGFSMWPGTTMKLQIEGADEISIIKVIKTRVPELGSNEVRNREVKLGPNKKDGLMVVCGDGSVLELLEVQPPMKKRMDAKSYWNGHRGKSIEWVDDGDEAPFLSNDNADITPTLSSTVTQESASDNCSKGIKPLQTF